MEEMGDKIHSPHCANVRLQQFELAKLSTHFPRIQSFLRQKSSVFIGNLPCSFSPILFVGDVFHHFRG